MAPESTITICRPCQKYIDRSTTYTVWIDNQDVGEVNDGEIQRFSVKPGFHQVLLGISSRFLGSGRIWTSKGEEIEAKTGGVADLTCSPKPLTGIFGPHHRLELSQADTVR